MSSCSRMTLIATTARTVATSGPGLRSEPHGGMANTSSRNSRLRPVKSPLVIVPSSAALHVAMFGRDAHGESVKRLGQHDLAREPAVAGRAGGEIEHVFLFLACGRQARKVLGSDDYV